ncbi:3'(2'),5'-bisphosphate nucleotidase CysQ [Gammaproteobacteria bacterium]|nr:3'(2'),5'-bisphosphate nucleotidase CysQ [Gammaproteobacteria bacterium]
MSSFSTYKESIDKLIEISFNAGKAIMDIYNTDFVSKEKKDHSPITEADIVSNEIITNALKKLAPDIPILSEESANISFSDRAKWNEYWLVDPLDGTKEFIKKNGEFTTNIALIRGNRPVFGVIHAPAKSETYWGAEEIGAYMLNGDVESDSKKISVYRPNNSEIRIISSRSHPSPQLRSLFARLTQYNVIEIGSSLKFCKIAAGEADCYPRLGPTSEWDSAAGEIIALSAGGIMTDLKGHPIRYNLKRDYLNPSFVLSNNTKDQEKILSLI